MAYEIALTFESYGGNDNDRQWNWLMSVDALNALKRKVTFLLPK
jgi:hypothetical protein